ncbi:tetratricopeptide repeat-containing response regulator [Chitiniphilus eburneus]|uniref:Tetratricopeptide repeat protein n=1 Tax=Chitiniphilus eburneus TaxID=2571148 RepID=A0A4U0PXB8_9NEIS|nr:tetratricopeptide repeat-containing response regulator [Chitiniphilus eburneus]TJZ72880.1 tetratricopeptide repeat protein [Chitiniphilus eburneus]
MATNFASHHCLVVDDFQGMRYLMRDMLRECGAVHVEMASNGKEALQRLLERRYDIVLCDYNLGQGKNGQQLLEEAKLRQLIGPATTWIMITAEKSSDWIMGAVEYQPDSYLLKPITADLLLSRLEKIAVRKQAFADIAQAMSNKQYTRAIALCDERLAYDTVNASELQRLKGSLLLDAGEIDAAQKLYETVLANREIAWARTGLGRICFQQGEYEAARDHFQISREQAPGYLEAYDWLARTQQRLGDAEHAESTLSAALKLSPNSPLRQKSLGELALQRGDLDVADAAFRKSIAVGEHSILKTPEAYLGLAKVCSKSSRSDEALKVLKSVQHQFSDDDVALRAKSAEGMIYTQENQLSKAGAVANELKQMLQERATRPDSTASLEVAELMLATGQRDQAVSLLQDVVRNNHEDNLLIDKVQAVFDSANMKAEGSNLVEACRREAVELMNSGVLLARDGKLPEALAAMRGARDKLPANARVLFNFAFVAVMYLQKLGTDEALIEESRQALREANRVSPGEKRFSQLMDALNKLEQR